MERASGGMGLRSPTKIATRARALRRNVTEPEIMLWSRLKGRGRDRPIFRAQHPFQSMIFDFYCPAAKLAIEVDGRTHWDDDARAKDDARDYWLRTQGVTVMRIGAGEVYRNLSQVEDAVIRQAEELIRKR